MFGLPQIALKTSEKKKTNKLQCCMYYVLAVVESAMDFRYYAYIYIYIYIYTHYIRA
jgi:hypothetical protein